MPRITRSARAVLAAAIGIGLFATSVAPASASDQNQVQRGATLLGSVNRGGRSCSDMNNSDFAAVGEFAMQRMIGSPQAHEAMDQLMTRTMGASRLGAMHRFMGERLSGCASGPAPRGFAQMMGMVGMMGSSGRGFGPMMGGGPGGYPGGVGVPGMMGRGGTGYGPVYGPAMMGGRYAPGNGYGPGMMGGRLSSGNNNNAGWGTGATVAAILIGVTILLLAAAAVLASRRRRPTSTMPSAIETLDRRLARGEIDAAEYQRRRAALGGTGA